MASETPLTDAAVIHIPETPYSVPVELYGQELVYADHARQLERALRMAVSEGFILDDVDCDSLDNAVMTYMEKARKHQ